MSSSFPIPLLLINHNLFFDQEITTVDQVVARIDPGGIQEQAATQKTTLALWEMTRVNVLHSRLNRQDNGLFALWQLWNDLGYTSQVDHLLLSPKANDGLFNPKLSMFLRRECFGTWALVPKEIWNIAKDIKQ